MTAVREYYTDLLLQLNMHDFQEASSLLSVAQLVVDAPHE